MSSYESELAAAQSTIEAQAREIGEKDLEIANLLGHLEAANKARRELKRERDEAKTSLDLAVAGDVVLQAALREIEELREGLNRQKRLRDWFDRNGGRVTTARAVTRAAEEMEELRESVTSEGRIEDCAEEAADVYLCLLLAADLIGCDLHASAERKMVKNESRTWRVDETGALYHVKPNALLSSTGEPKPIPPMTDAESATKESLRQFILDEAPELLDREEKEA